MSKREEEMIERLRRMYEAFNRGDYDGVASFLGEEFELHRTGGLSVVKGKEAVRSWMEPDAMEDQVFEPLEFRVNGDKVFVWAHARSRGRGSGIELEFESGAVWTADEDGVFNRAEAFLPHQRQEALVAAGLPPESEG